MGGACDGRLSCSGTGFKLQNIGTYQQWTSTQEIAMVQSGMVWSRLVIGGPRCQETIFAATVFIRASCFSYSSPVGGYGLRYMDGLNNTIQPDWTSHRFFWKTSWGIILKFMMFICVNCCTLSWISPWSSFPDLPPVLVWSTSTCYGQP